jgi:zinc transporter ZupT
MFRLCHQCGHDFGDGISVSGPLAPIDYSPRMWIVVGGMVAVALLVAGYFYVLMK